MMRNVKLRIFLFCSLCICPVYAQDGKASKSTTVAAFRGTAITQEEVQQAAAQDLDVLEIQHLQAEANYRRAKHQAVEAALARIVEDRLLDAEVSSRGITRQALLDKELAGKVKEPTMEDMDAHYPPGRQPTGDSREKVFARMQQFFRSENYNKAKAEYVAQLKKKYGVSVTLQPYRLKVDAAGSPSKGSDTAPVTMVEFSNFQCTSCGQFEAAMQDILKKYGKHVRLVYRNFAVGQSYAEMAAEASLCAADQGRFWEMHDLLSQSKQPEPQFLNMYASRVNLNLENFSSCMSSRLHADKVKQDSHAAAGLGVTGTPALFVNGRPILVLRDADEIAKVIEEELRGSSRLSGAQTEKTHSQQASNLPANRK